MIVWLLHTSTAVLYMDDPGVEVSAKARSARSRANHKKSEADIEEREAAYIEHAAQTNFKALSS